MTHTVVQSKTWTDAEPDTLRVSVETDVEFDVAYVIFSTHATWLSAEQALEVAQYVVQCAYKVAEINHVEPEESTDA